VNNSSISSSDDTLLTLATYTLDYSFRIQSNRQSRQHNQSVVIINGAAALLNCPCLWLRSLHSCCVDDCCTLMLVIPHFNLVPVACMQQVCAVFLLLAWLRH